MSLRDNLSKLSPNEFLEKMQDMFQMYQESQEDYYEEGLKQDRQTFRNSDSNYNKGYIFPDISSVKKYVSVIVRFIEKLYAGLKNKKADREQAERHMEQVLTKISLKQTVRPTNLYEFLELVAAIADQFGNIRVDSLIEKH